VTCELREYQSATQTVTCHARRQIAMQPHGEPELVGDLPQNLKKVSSDLDLVFVDFLRPAILQSLFPGAGQASPYRQPAAAHPHPPATESRLYQVHSRSRLA
jgi:hypothetical protein